MTTEEAVRCAADCLRSYIHEALIRQALLAEGFTADKVDVIIRWAQQTIEQEKQ